REKEWEKLRFRLRPVTYFPLYVTANPVIIGVGRQMSYTLEYAPRAWVQLHVKNINPQINDKLVITWGGGDYYRAFRGFNDTILRRMLGNTNNYLQISFYRDDIRYRYDDTVY